MNIIYEGEYNIRKGGDNITEGVCMCMYVCVCGGGGGAYWSMSKVLVFQKTRLFEHPKHTLETRVNGLCQSSIAIIVIAHPS